jgi:hypothetical protein
LIHLYIIKDMLHCKHGKAGKLHLLAVRVFHVFGIISVGIIT